MNTLCGQHTLGKNGTPEAPVLPPPPFAIVGWDESDDKDSIHADYIVVILGERWRVDERALTSYTRFVEWFALEGIAVSWPAIEQRPRAERRLLWLQAIAAMISQVRAKDREEYEAMRAKKST